MNLYSLRLQGSKRNPLIPAREGKNYPKSRLSDIFFRHHMHFFTNRSCELPGFLSYRFRTVMLSYFDAHDRPG